MDAPPSNGLGVYIIQNENGQLLTKDTLRSKFDNARELTGRTFSLEIYGQRPRLVRVALHSRED